MALNKTILKKVTQKTDENPELQDFLQKLLEFESEPRGWYTKAYAEILEKVCVGGDINANKKH